MKCPFSFLSLALIVLSLLSHGQNNDNELKKVSFPGFHTSNGMEQLGLLWPDSYGERSKSQPLIKYHASGLYRISVKK